MTPEDDHDLERSGDDIIAAEYVLGVLPASERQEATKRIQSDAAFAHLVEGWEARLSPLAESYEHVEPPAALKARIDAALFGESDTAPVSSAAGFWNSLWLWRGLTAASLAAAIILGTLFASQPPAGIPSPRLIAALAQDDSDVSLIALYDGASGQIILSQVSGARPADADFELWVIEGDRAPVSLGILEGEADIRLDPVNDVVALMRVGSLLAVSVEPPGGSATGQPTGPVVAAGKLRAI